MKKKYQKPQLELENFRLTEAVSACEDGRYLFNTEQTCGNNYDYEDEMFKAFDYFNSGYKFTCKNTIPEGFEDGKGTCYHTSTGKNVFSS